MPLELAKYHFSSVLQTICTDATTALREDAGCHRKARPFESRKEKRSREEGAKSF